MNKPSVKRLFVAVDFPNSIKTQLVALKADIPTARWVSREQIHLTLFFIGETDRTEAVKEALASAKTVPFDLVMRGVGRFPPGDRKPARVLWVGLENQPALVSLQQEISTALVKQGFTAEERPYSPHITLARLERSSPEIERFLKTHQDFYAPPFNVAQFILFSSVLTSQGARHTHEVVYPLREK